MFFILAISLDGGKTWNPDFDTKFDTGKGAQDQVQANQRHAKHVVDRLYYSEADKAEWAAKRWRVRQVVDTDDDNFVAREAAKNLNYVELPYRSWWEMAHIHPEDKQKIRFFRSIENAIAERYTVCAMPRFLSSYCNLDHSDLEQKMVELNYYDHDATFTITQDADEIEAAYVNGPRSCMNDPDDYPLGQTHPSRVYAGPDLGVAIMMRGDRCVGRAVVWPEKKIWYTAYGHVALIRNELEKAGYTKNENRTAWAGARIMKIYDEEEGLFVCPYLDMSATVRQTRCGKYLRLANDDGSLSSRGCHGYADD